MSPKAKTTTKPALRRGRGGVGHGWVAAEGSGAVDASILPDPVKKPRMGILACTRCREELSPQNAAAVDHNGAVIGDACRKCWAAFACEFQREADWHDVCHRCHEDKKYDEAFEMAAQVLAGERRSAHSPEEVKHSEGYEVAVTRSFIGVPRGDFTDAVGMTPAEAGYPEVDCPTETNGTFKGVLLVNPLRPFIEFNLTYLKRACKDEHVLPLDRSCRAGQGAAVLKQLGGAQQNDRFVTKLRNCALTVDQVAEETKCPAFSQRLFRGFAASSSSSGSGTFPLAVAQVAMAASPSHLKRLPTADLATPPAKKPMSPLASDSSSFTRASFGATARSNMMDIDGATSVAFRAAFGGAVARSAPSDMCARPGMQQVNELVPGKTLKDLCDYHSGQACIESLLHGRNLGHGVRWAEEFLKKHSTMHAACLNELGAQLEVAKSAKVFAQGNIRKLDQSDFDLHINKLCDWGAYMPDPMKLAVLDRCLEKYAALDLQEEFMSTVLPWPHDDESSFTTTKPRLHCIPSDPDASAAHFRTRVLEWLRGLLRRGTPGVGKTTEVAAYIMGYLEEHGPDTDFDGEVDAGGSAFDAAVECVTAAAGALILLARMEGLDMVGMDLIAADTLDEILGAKDLKGREAVQSPWTAISQAIEKSADCWEPRASTWKRFAPALRRFCPEVKQAMHAIASAKSFDDDGSISPSIIHIIRKTFVPAVAELPGGACVKFEEIMEAKIRSVMTHALSVVEARGRYNDGTTTKEVDANKLTASLDAFVGIVAKNFANLRSMTFEVTEKLRALKTDSQGSDIFARVSTAIDAFNAAQDELSEHMPIVEAALREAIEKLSDPRKVMAAKKDDLLEAFRRVMTICRSSVCDLVAWLPMARQLLDMLPQDEDTADERSNFGLLDAAAALQGRRAEWEALAADDASRWAADDKHKLVSAWRSAHQGLVDMMQKAESVGEIVKDVMKHSNLGLEALSVFVGDNLQKDINVLADACSKMLDDAEWPCKDAVAEAPWDEFVTNAYASWLGYNDGDKLRMTGEDFKQKVKQWESLASIFDGFAWELKCSIDPSDLTERIDGLVSTVKTMKALEKTAGQPAKFKRLCKNRIAQVMDNPLLRRYMPGALWAKLDAGRRA